MQAKRTRSYVEEACRQIQEKPGVLDILVVNASGNPVRTTMQEKRALENAGLWTQLMQKSKYAIQHLDEENEVLMLRVRTKKHETLITPDEKVTFIVVQNAVDKIFSRPT